MQNTTTFGRVRRKMQRVPVSIFLAFFLLLVVLLIAVFGSRLSGHNPTVLGLRNRLEPPYLFGGTPTHLLGTDQLGRDILSRILMATQTTMVIATLGTLVGLLIGASLGILSGLVGGRVDTTIMFLVDTQMAIPFTLIALTVIAIFGSNLTVLIPVIGLSSWCQFARLARGEVRSILGMEYVQGARALGISEWRIAWKYILPNIASPLVVLATYNFSQIMLLESSLSFLGLGVQPPGASLGSLVGAGRDYLMTAWWIALAPGLMLVLITMIMSLLGDYVRDVYDPRLRH